MKRGRSELFLCHLKGALKTIQAARHLGGCVLWCGGKIPGWLALNRPGSLNRFEFWDGGLSEATFLLTGRVLLRSEWQDVAGKLRYVKSELRVGPLCSARLGACDWSVMFLLLVNVKKLV